LVSFLAASTILSTLASDRPLTACRRCKHIHPHHSSSRSVQRSSRSQSDKVLTECGHCKRIHPSTTAAGQHSAAADANLTDP
jgi:hypothetical protein